MLPLYEDPHFTFRFAEDRIIPRFHLEGVEAGRRVSVFKIDPDTNERLGLLAHGLIRAGLELHIDVLPALRHRWRMPAFERGVHPSKDVGLHLGAFYAAQCSDQRIERLRRVLPTQVSPREG